MPTPDERQTDALPAPYAILRTDLDGERGYAALHLTPERARRLLDYLNAAENGVPLPPVEDEDTPVIAPAGHRFAGAYVQEQMDARFEKDAFLVIDVDLPGDAKSPALEYFPDGGWMRFGQADFITGERREYVGSIARSDLYRALLFSAPAEDVPGLVREMALDCGRDALAVIEEGVGPDDEDVRRDIGGMIASEDVEPLLTHSDTRVRQRGIVARALIERAERRQAAEQIIRETARGR